MIFAGEDQEKSYTLQQLVQAKEHKQSKQMLYIMKNSIEITKLRGNQNE